MHVDANYPDKAVWVECCPCALGCPKGNAVHPQCMIQQIKRLQQRLTTIRNLMLEGKAEEVYELVATNEG